MYDIRRRNTPHDHDLEGGGNWQVEFCQSDSFMRRCLVAVVRSIYFPPLYIIYCNCKCGEGAGNREYLSRTAGATRSWPSCTRDTASWPIAKPYRGYIALRYTRIHILAMPSGVCWSVSPRDPCMLVLIARLTFYSRSVFMRHLSKRMEIAKFSRERKKERENKDFSRKIRKIKINTINYIFSSF